MIRFLPGRLTAILLLAAGLDRPAAAGAQEPPAPRLQAVLAHGYRFAYRTMGSGRPVLLVHDAPADYRYWDRALESLSDSFQVTAYSRRYHYPNPARPDDLPYSFETSAADLLAVIRALGLERPILVGHGWGATVVLLAALREPALTGGLILQDPLADSLIESADLRRGAALAHIRGYAEASARAVPRDPESAPRALTELFEGPGAWERLPDALRLMRRDNAGTALMAGAPEPALSCSALGRLTLPVVLLREASASPRQKATDEGLLQCLPAARAIGVPGAPFLHPDQFVAALRDALRTVAGP